MARAKIKDGIRWGRGVFLCLYIIGAWAAAASAQSAGKNPRKKKASVLSIVTPDDPKKKKTIIMSSDPTEADATFAEISLEKTLIIEGRTEKPAVQFTLLKEAPPEKEIRFETSFMENILKLDRENTFQVEE